jgi:hypothetical protein
MTRIVWTVALLLTSPPTDLLCMHNAQGEEVCLPEQPMFPPEDKR